MRPRRNISTPPSATASVQPRQGQAILSDRQWRAIADALDLSDRELEILRCIFDDRIEAAIARELGISSHTVHTHLERLYRKLGVTCRCSAAVRVFAEHLAIEAAQHQPIQEQPVCSSLPGRQPSVRPPPPEAPSSRNYQPRS